AHSRDDVTSFSGSTAYPSVINIRIDACVDDAKCVGEREWGRRFVSSQQGAEESVVDLGVEQRHAQSVWGEDVRVGPREARYEAVQPEATQVIGHLRRGVRGAEQAGDEGAQAPVVEAGDGMHRQTQGAGQSHDA